MRESAPINVVVWGRGDPAICVHGSLSWGTFAFREQRPLARMRALLLPDRRGYGASPPTPRADFDVDAADVAARLDGPTDLALTARSVRAARATMTERPPWEAELDLGALVQARRPTLVVSGRWDNLAAGEDALGHRAFTAVCEALTRALGAEHAVIDRWAHGCQYSGKPFNDALRTFWDSARPPPPPPPWGSTVPDAPVAAATLITCGAERRVRPASKTTLKRVRAIISNQRSFTMATQATDGFRSRA